MSAWDGFYRERASLVAQMIGAADFFEANGSDDAVVARAFREYVARARAIEVPAPSSPVDAAK